MCLGFVTPSKASFYVRPRAGVAIPTSGNDPYYSVGGTLGYKWLPFFSTEASYLRLLGHNTAPDGHTVRGQGVVSAPIGIFAPFGSLGVGWIDYDVPGSSSEVMTIFGGGLTVSKILFLSASVGVEYAIIPNKADLIEPYVSIGITF